MGTPQVCARAGASEADGPPASRAGYAKIPRVCHGAFDFQSGRTPCPFPPNDYGADIFSDVARTTCASRITIDRDEVWQKRWGKKGKIFGVARPIILARDTPAAPNRRHIAVCLPQPRIPSARCIQEAASGVVKVRCNRRSAMAQTRVADPVHSTEQAMQATHEGLDRVRDILFGPQMREQDHRRQEFEAEIARQLAAFGEESRKRLDSLEGFVKREIASLLDILKTESVQRADALQGLAEQFKQTTAGI